ncbi:DUF1000-domain-containing protein [Testicularia cyperi]|uniref:DUF1000-domain-containing protein n=1 Tax=Testicularia cyperi TaxID=1882483 RepID=A0A317XS80_9BASI|nr:DUF1000-domain-containing protein [Testicularia cyperi]
MSCNPTGDQDSRDPQQPSSSTLAAVDGDAGSLFQYIVRDKVWGANLDPPESAKNVIKPWNERLSTHESTQSNVDDQLAITVPFTCPVRLKSILINTGTGDFAPSRCRAFINRPDGVDFDEADQATASIHPSETDRLARSAHLGPVGSGKAQADFALLHGQDGVIEYPVSVARFSNTNSVTIILSHSNATTLSRVFYLGFRGTALVLNKEPGERLNIAAANAADRPVDGLREKRGASQGLAGGSTPGKRASPRYVVRDNAAAQRIAELASHDAQSLETSPRRSPRSAARHTNVSNPSTPTARRVAPRSQAPEIPSPSKRTPAASPRGARTPRTAPAAAVRRVQPQTVQQQAMLPRPSDNDGQRRRSLSQPPPNEVLLRQLKAISATPSVSRNAHRSDRTPSGSSATPRAASGLSTATPGKRFLGTPRRVATDAPSADASSSVIRGPAAVQTPATERRKKRNDALLASAQRTREKKDLRKSAWGGLGGWAGGREESPMDLLRRLARAPGFVVPATPSEDSIAMPPPDVSRRSDRHELAADAADPSGRDRARDSLASSSVRSSIAGRSSLSSRASRATMLVPGESIPGDLTRDDTLDSAEMDDSVTSPSHELSRLSDIGVPRRRSGVGIARGGIFAALADRTKTGRMSTGSRVSFADQMSPSSTRLDDLSSRRNIELERSWAPSAVTGDSFASTRSNEEASDDRAIERLDELTRASFFGSDGSLQSVEASLDSATPRRSFVRSMSEPLDNEIDRSDIVFDDFGTDEAPDMSHVDEEDEVSDSLAVEDEDAPSQEDDEQGAGRRLQDQDASHLSDSRSRTGMFDDADLSANLSRLSQQLDSGGELSFQVDDPYSDDDAEYALEAVQGENEYDEEQLDEDDDDDDDDDRQAGVRQLDLMDPKDLNAILKRRIVKKRKARTSPFTGAPVPPLPASVMRDLFSSFLFPSSGSSGGSLLSSSTRGPGRSGKRAKLDSTVLDELDSACHEFFGQFAQNLLTQSKARTGRKATPKSGATTINEADVVAVLKQQGHVTPRHDASSLAHRLLPRELTDQMDLSKWAKSGTVQTTLASALGIRKSRKRPRDVEADASHVSATTVADETA